MHMQLLVHTDLNHTLTLDRDNPIILLSEAGSTLLPPELGSLARLSIMFMLHLHVCMNLL